MLKDIKNKINIKQILIICFIVMIVLLIFVIGILVTRIKTLEESITQLPDTITNTIVIEKIKDDIFEQEELINDYKQEYYEETKRANNLNDSATVKLFFELASE